MRDLCARFGVTRRTIHRWIAELEFPKGSGRLGRKGHYWSTDAVEAWERAVMALGKGDER